MRKINTRDLSGTESRADRIEPVNGKCEAHRLSLVDCPRLTSVAVSGHTRAQCFHSCWIEVMSWRSDLYLAFFLTVAVSAALDPARPLSPHGASIPHCHIPCGAMTAASGRLPPSRANPWGSFMLGDLHESNDVIDIAVALNSPEDANVARVSKEGVHGCPKCLIEDAPKPQTYGNPNSAGRPLKVIDGDLERRDLARDLGSGLSTVCVCCSLQALRQVLNKSRYDLQSINSAGLIRPATACSIALPMAGRIDIYSQYLISLILFSDITNSQ